MDYCAEVVKLVDTHGSGPCRGNPVEVRVLSSAPLLRGVASLLTPCDALWFWFELFSSKRTTPAVGQR